MNTALLIGHLDTDLAPKHPLFEGKIDQFVAFDKQGNLEHTLSSNNPQSHGALTAQIIFDDAHYSLPPLTSSAKLAAVSVPTRGKTLLNLLKGMDLLLGMAPQIVCMPIGIKKQIPIFYPMIQAFLRKGILPILPIGNKGAGTAHVPGCYPGVLAVGGLASDGRVARYSGSYLEDSGACLKPDIMAPGSRFDGKKAQQGTSFACAYIAGVAARLLQAHPETQIEALRQALLNTTQPLPPSQSHRCRNGVVQPEAALAYLSKTGNYAFASPKDPIPSFLEKLYQDHRFLFEYKYAKPDQVIEALILPSPDSEKSEETQGASPLSRALITQIQQATGIAPEQAFYFVHADMAHIRAQAAFFEALLQDDRLWAISAVDVNMFEM